MCGAGEDEACGEVNQRQAVPNAAVVTRNVSNQQKIETFSAKESLETKVKSTSVAVSIK